MNLGVRSLHERLDDLWWSLMRSRHGWDADFERRWRAATAIADGPATTVHVAAALAGGRHNHALAEGVSL
ncbi:hypothetical protein N0B31_02830 [Salinirubellus salinus]|uniref:Uncharacterized protein n=1 Tax=Salinirubellus salinus TaxID=1364945 RepID=A0A9E7R4A5_9EURY|nr:hypothetical protein [Salinirubellus salinus]UWM55226.1 hypothetical protein N0B31_02830 [Salinirubellus salinus]